MSNMHRIADLIVREAVDRYGDLDLVTGICTVRVEVMLEIMAVLAGIREAESRALAGSGGPDRS